MYFYVKYLFKVNNKKKYKSENILSNFKLSDNAAKRIAFLIKKEPLNSFFRLTVSGGGCSGFQYNFSFDNLKNNDDLVFNNQNVEIIIDKTSINFIDGAELDYKDDLSGACFEVKNPNASAGCGCGTSFSI